MKVKCASCGRTFNYTGKKAEVPLCSRCASFKGTARRNPGASPERFNSKGGDK